MWNRWPLKLNIFYLTRILFGRRMISPNWITRSSNRQLPDQLLSMPIRMMTMKRKDIILTNQFIILRHKLNFGSMLRLPTKLRLLESKLVRQQFLWEAQARQVLGYLLRQTALGVIMISRLFFKSKQLLFQWARTKTLTLKRCMLSLPRMGILQARRLHRLPVLRALRAQRAHPLQAVRAHHHRVLRLHRLQVHLVHRLQKARVLQAQAPRVQVRHPHQVARVRLVHRARQFLRAHRVRQFLVFHFYQEKSIVLVRMWLGIFRPVEIVLIGNQKRRIANGLI